MTSAWQSQVKQIKGSTYFPLDMARVLSLFIRDRHQELWV